MGVIEAYKLYLIISDAYGPLSHAILEVAWL
jgi:hypothetical protein